MQQDTPSPTITSDNSFVILPHWVIFSGISAGALKLYAVLAKYANNETHQAFPSRAALARDVGKSRDSIDRYMKELEALGALRVQRRKRAHSKENLVSLYTIVTTNPNAEVAALVRPGGGMDAAENYTHLTKPTFPVAVTFPSDAPDPSPVIETITAHTLEEQLGISKELKTRLIDEAVEYWEDGSVYEPEWFHEYSDRIEAATGIYVGDALLNRRFDDRLAEIIEANLDRGPRYGASVWLGTLVNYARTQ